MFKLLVHIQKYKKECILGPLFKLLEALLELFVPLVIASISGSEKIKRNLFLRPTDVDLSILDVVPADKVKEMSTNELADYSRGLIERSLPKAVKEAV